MASNVDAQAFRREVSARYRDDAFEDAERTHGEWRGRIEHFTAGGARKG